MVRVLRPEGQLLILETGYPSNPVVRFGYQLFLFTIARLIGLLLTGRVWPFTYLARSVKQFLTPAQMVERLQQLQTQVEYVPLSYGLASLYIATKLNPSTTDDCAADVRRRILAGGGPMHADCEAALLEDGSVQSDIWGADGFQRLKKSGLSR